MQRNKSLRFVISHQLYIPPFSSAAHLLSANFPLSSPHPSSPPPPPHSHHFSFPYFYVRPLFCLSSPSPISVFCFPLITSSLPIPVLVPFQSSALPDFHKIIPPVWRP